MKSVKLWCCIQSLPNTILPISISYNKTIYDLKELIREKSGERLARYHPMDLELKKIDLNEDEVSGEYRPSANNPSLKSSMKICDVWDEQPADQRMNVFVGLLHGVGEPTAGNTGVEGILNSDFAKKYEDTFIKLKKRGSYKDSDIDENHIRWLETSPPVFVSDFEQQLDSKPRPVDDSRPYSNYTFIATSWEAYFGPPNNTTPEAGPSEEPTPGNQSHEKGKQQRRNAKICEMIHIMDAAAAKWEERWATQPLKENLVNVMFFSRFLNSVPENGTIVAKTGTDRWPFNLVIQCADAPTDEQLCRFQPRSDFLILKSKLPRLLVEVNSTPPKVWPEDLIRMLLTGAAVVRFANRFLKSFKTTPFILVTLYIHANGNATRYTLFQKQKDRKEVYYKRTDFSLGDPVGRVTFMRQFYNLFHILEKNEDDEDTRREIETLLDGIIENNLKSLNTKDNNPKGKKRKRSGAHDDAGAGGVSAEDQVVLRAHGYEVKPEAIVDASGIVYEPLFKKPSHILTVFRPSIPGKELIAKKVHEESNELEILQLLNTLQPNSEHVISLVDSFQTQSTFWVILPKMESVAAYVVVAPLRLSEKVAQICWGLIQGVAHLHKGCIAHRDIKPSNLVVDRDFCLKIIDFDLAMQVKDEDEEVNDQCGTKHWMAPEVEKKLAYSPVKADRWSSGRVLLYLLDELRKEDEPLRTIGRKLTAHNPKQRPSMGEVAAPPSDVTNIGHKKTLRSRQPKTKIDGENAKPPKMKKQRDRQNKMVVSADIYEPQASRPVVDVL